MKFIPILIRASSLSLAFYLLLGMGKVRGQIVEIDLGSQPPSVLVNVLMGTGVSASNITYLGTGSSSGTFAGGATAFGINSGIILSTGRASGIIGTATDTSSTCNDLPGDTDLAALEGVPVTDLYDATVLSFDFVPTYNTVSFQYVFASEEYNGWVGDGFNDVFGFFVNGTNVALIPGTATDVSINSVNACTNPLYFVNNIGVSGGGDCAISQTPAGLPTAMNGMTTVLTAIASVIPGVTNHIKLAIADGGDCLMDSNVLIAADSFTSILSPTPISTPTNTGTPCGYPGNTCTPTWTPTLPPPPATWTPCGYPGNTCTFTPTWTNTSTYTITPTATGTTTDDVRPTFTQTTTPTSTPTNTITDTATPTATLTPCGFPGNTCTFTPSPSPTPTVPILDQFLVSKNVVSPSSPVSIYLGHFSGGGTYKLILYNSAGEYIKTLDTGQMMGPFQKSYLWDGTNCYGDACASGVYILYLYEPYAIQFKRIILIH